MKWEQFVELVTNDKIISEFSLQEDFLYSDVYHTKRGIHFDSEKQTVGFYNGTHCFPLLKKIYNEDIHEHHDDENSVVLYYQKFHTEATSKYETFYMNDGGEEQREVIKTLETYDLKPVYFKFYNIMKLCLNNKELS